jgi:hypothetical protein
LAKNPQSKDDALEALDFIVNVLKEHERDLDKLINELANVTEQLGDTGALNIKVESVEEKINNLQKEVTNLIGYLSNAPKQALSTMGNEQATLPQPKPAPTANATHVMAAQSGTSVILKCKLWEDFQVLGVHAQTLSFCYKEDEKVFQADALKGNQIVTYSGPLPKLSALIKASLSKQLDVAEQNILEGILALG